MLGSPLNMTPNPAARQTSPSTMSTADAIRQQVIDPHRATLTMLYVMSLVTARTQQHPCRFTFPQFQVNCRQRQNGSTAHGNAGGMRGAPGSIQWSGRSYGSRHGVQGLLCVWRCPHSYPRTARCGVDRPLPQLCVCWPTRASLTDWRTQQYEQTDSCAHHFTEGSIAPGC